MSSHPTKITFFEFLTPLITSGQKTITIRDESESHYVPNTEVEVFTLETDRKVCDIKILSVEPLNFDEINEFHAEQEAIELPKLKQLIREIYPDIDKLFVIEYELIKKQTTKKLDDWSNSSYSTAHERKNK
ncbi:N(4)-acetylcytidine aminohydrolase [Vibrio parahaemolyticus]